MDVVRTAPCKEGGEEGLLLVATCLFMCAKVRNV